MKLKFNFFLYYILFPLFDPNYEVIDEKMFRFWTLSTGYLLIDLLITLNAAIPLYRFMIMS